MRVIQHLSRKTSAAVLIPEIDGFRFFAIFTVLLYHINTHFTRAITDITGESYYVGNWLFEVLREGSVGVDVFFGISGFILALPFARARMFGTQPVTLRNYYLRRLTRLEPPYVISLIVFLAVHVLILHQNFNELLPNFLASLFYVHNIVFDKWSEINPVTWSLEVEVQFYVLAPLLAAVFSIRNSVLRRFVIVAAIAASIIHYNVNYELIKALHLRKSLFIHLHQFLIGFLFADFFLTTWKSWLKSRSFSYDLIGVVAFPGLLLFNAPFNLSNDFMFVLCLFLTFIILFKGRSINAFFANPWIVVIGGMCYSIYLLHYALIAFLTGFTDRWFTTDYGYTLNLFIQIVVQVPVVLLISAIYFVLIERPCMDKDWVSKFKTKVTSVIQFKTKSIEK